MERMEIDSEMISFSKALIHVTVGTNTRRFECLGGNIFGLEKDEARAIREAMSVGRLCASFITLETAFRHATAEAGLDKGTAAKVTVATGRTTTHRGRSKAVKTV
jgi:hypothetical protein